MESFFVALLFSFIQHLSIILTFYFHHLANFQGSKISVCWDINYLHWFNIDHLLCYVVFLSKGFFVSQIWNCHPIIGGITWDTSNDSCTFFHADSHHGKCVNLLIHCQWSSNWKSQNLLSFECANYLNFLVLFGQTLISHIPCWLRRTDKDLIIFHFDCWILASWQKIAASLAVHGFWSKSSGNKENFSTIQMFFHYLILLKDLNFNQSKLLRSNSFSLRPVMICTHLFILWWVNRGSFTKIDISSFLKFSELPLNKWVVVRVHISCDEWSSMIDMNTESFQMSLS